MTGIPGYRDVPTVVWDNTAGADIDEAVDFIRLHHSETMPGGDPAVRLAAVRAEIDRTGTYAHTADELTFGARVAWRNASRCIGRLYWRSLQVFDHRAVTAPDDIFEHLVRHLRFAGGGRQRRGGVRHLRPAISVFPAAVPGRPYPRIWNEQLIRYAGYRQPDGSVTGDPRYVAFTAAMAARGWGGKGEAFDLLPLAIETPDAGVRLYELPPDAVLEVPIGHPDYPWFADFGLRWHAVPAIANMRLSIGGVQYPFAPFSGWYMGTEIGARNLADTDRYDMLPLVASRLGMDTSRESSLWRDRALVELNVAVLWSFEQAGLQISDHHTESRRFLTHIEHEERAGRTTPADWTWIVPPVSGSATPVFHRYYAEAEQKPNFYLDPIARDLGRFGEIRTGVAEPVQAGCPVAHGGAPAPAAAIESPTVAMRTVGATRLKIRPAAPVGYAGGEWPS